ncbi:MAG: T9SS type A sorting domain-containing protein [Bacteroidota bacterium]
MKSILQNQMGGNKHRCTLLSLLLCIVTTGMAQTDTVDVPSDRGHGEGGLNAAVSAAIGSGTLSKTVFRLEPFGYYILDSTITVPAGTRLTIVAPEPGMTQQTAPPMIVWSSRDGISTSRNFRCFGDITLKNIWLLSANTAGNQTFTGLKIEDSPDTIHGQLGTFVGVLFDYFPIPGEDAGGAVTVASRHFRGTFSNCYFRNCTDSHFRYYGRAVSFPYGVTGCHTDSLVFENCTFANIGYVYMQENGNYGDVIQFNHCTFLNVIMYPLESGWWHWLSVTNSVFVNPFLYGDVSYPNGYRDTVGGTMHIDSISTFGFPIPFTESDRHILFTHSSYFIEEWVSEYMASIVDPYSETFSVRPQPMLTLGTLAFFDNAVNGVKAFPFMNRAYLFDSTDPGFIFPPTNQEGIRRFLWKKWFNSEDTTWAFHPEDDIAGVWPMKENLSYTNPSLLTSGMGGFPPGDLYRWFPEKYIQWKAQAETENARISSWLATGTDPGGPDAVQTPSGQVSPSRYALSQNYPNPFNPKTVISGQLTVDSWAKLVVYDVLGRVVATLVDQKLHAGKFSYTFDARALANGMYFYRLEAEGKVIVKKMTLLK